MENLSEIVKATVMAVRQYDVECRAMARDKRLRNTKLLLQHYPELKAHVKNSEGLIKDEMEEEDNDIYLLDPSLKLESLRRSNTKTAMMLRHIESMFNFYQIYCDEHKYPVRYEIFRKYFLDGVPLADIAEEYSLTIRTAQRYIKQGLHLFSSLLFGVEGLGDVSEG